MTSMTEVVRAFLRNDGWPILEGMQDGCPLLETVFASGHASWRCHAQVFEPYGQLVFESVLPFTVGDGRLDETATLLLAVNWKLITGAFQLDGAAGEVRFRTSLLVPDGEPLTPLLVKGVVYSNVLTVARCYEEVAAVATSDAVPEAAMARLAL